MASSSVCFDIICFFPFKLHSFNQTLAYLECTNELASADLNIEDFFGRQNVMSPVS